MIARKLAALGILTSLLVVGCLVWGKPAAAVEAPQNAARPVGTQAAQPSAGLTRVVLDFHSLRTRETRRVVRYLPTASIASLAADGRPQLVSPSPELRRNAAAMSQLTRLARAAVQRGPSTGLDQPGRSPAKVKALASGGGPERVTGTWQAVGLS